MADDYRLRDPTLADAPRLAEVHLRSWQTAYRGIFPQPWLDDWPARLAGRTAKWSTWLANPDPPDSANILVETTSGEIVGFAGAGPRRVQVRSPHRGELYAIYLLAEHRGHGLGRRLFQWCVSHLRRIGHTDMMLWVVEGNPTCGFYAAMGGAVIQGETQPVTIAGTTVTEIAYGWDALPAPGSAR